MKLNVRMQREYVVRSSEEIILNTGNDDDVMKTHRADIKLDFVDLGCLSVYLTPALKALGVEVVLDLYWQRTRLQDHHFTEHQWTYESGHAFYVSHLKI